MASMNAQEAESSNVVRKNLGSTLNANEDLLTKAQLAERLHKSPRCVEIWMQRRYLPYFKIGRSVLFRWPDVVAHLDRFRVG